MHKMISNPCNWFITGNETNEFTYEGGNTLYHFSARDNNFSSYHDVNVVFFANNEIHALDVLRRMFKFAFEKHMAYKLHEINGHPELYSRNEVRLKEISKYLNDMNSDDIKITLAPKNQLYKVGWAYNDTIL